MISNKVKHNGKQHTLQKRLSSIDENRAVEPTLKTCCHSLSGVRLTSDIPLDSVDTDNEDETDSVEGTDSSKHSCFLNRQIIVCVIVPALLVMTNFCLSVWIMPSSILRQSMGSMGHRLSMGFIGNSLNMGSMGSRISNVSMGHRIGGSVRGGRVRSPFTRNRNYTDIPVTAEESEKLTLSYKLSGLNSITAAVCHPTLFGDISWGRVTSFISYYRLLGFDHIFLWYHDSVYHEEDDPTNKTGSIITELNALPYVSLHEYRASDFRGAAGKKNFGQEIVQNLCTSRKWYGAGYDWVLTADADEYLYFRKAWNVKEFLQAQQAKNYTYLSFGKWMYTQVNAGWEATSHHLWGDNGFDLDRFAFTGGSYCFGTPGDSYCPGWRGLSKTMTRSSAYRKVIAHGFETPAEIAHAIHFDTAGTSEAHIKEWNSLLVSPPEWNITLRKPGSGFYVSQEHQVSTPSAMESHQKSAGGKVRFGWDSELVNWLSFVASGCGHLDDPRLSQHK